MPGNSYMKGAPKMKLGVNIDHVATVREARRSTYPDPVTAAALAELAGADSIVMHLREDRRHIKDRDLKIVRETSSGKRVVLRPLENAGLQGLA